MQQSLAFHLLKTVVCARDEDVALTPALVTAWTMLRAELSPAHRVIADEVRWSPQQQDDLNFVIEGVLEQFAEDPALEAEIGALLSEVSVPLITIPTIYDEPAAPEEVPPAPPAEPVAPVAEQPAATGKLKPWLFGVAALLLLATGVIIVRQLLASPDPAQGATRQHGAKQPTAPSEFDGSAAPPPASLHNDYQQNDSSGFSSSGLAAIDAQGLAQTLIEQREELDNSYQRYGKHAPQTARAHLALGATYVQTEEILMARAHLRQAEYIFRQHNLPLAADDEAAVNSLAQALNTRS